jgi:tetratricopeptide repeat protein 30
VWYEFKKTVFAVSPPSSSDPLMEQTLPLGQYTSTIYGAIKEQRYNEAIDILLIEYQNFPRSRAALSLLAYCFYHINDFQTAAQYYELLLAICPEVDEYRIYYAQSLYKAGQYPEAIRSAVRVDGPQYSQRIKMLQAVVKYEQDELSSSKALLDQCHSDDPDVIVNYAAISYKEGKYDQARTQLTEAINTLGYQPDLALNIALCYFREVWSFSSLSLTAPLPLPLPTETIRASPSSHR